jgi:hypothetical protein
MEFTYNSYLEFVLALVKNGYKISSYHDCDDNKKAVILRHDVDFDLEKAAFFSEKERKYNITSTYFVLVTSNFYNVFSSEDNRYLLKIVENGSEIGLHFDEAVYQKDDNLVNHILYESELLSYACGKKISTVSMHRPSKRTLESNLIIPGMINSYSKKFFIEYKYLSDSHMRWRENIDLLLQSSKYPLLQILTHPFWYFDERIDIKTILEKFIESASAKRYSDLKKNFTDLEEIIASKKYLKNDD